MAPRKQETEPTEHVYEQSADERGRIRLDRPFTAEEAAAQDAAHLAAQAEERANRFAKPTT